MSITQHLRISVPHPGLFAYYDGRIAGHRYASAKNWVDEGALALGIATYALVHGDAALVYDTHVSPVHGAAIRRHLEARGVRQFTIIYSHCHLDHIAGTSAFPLGEIIANACTARHLERDRAAIEAGTQSGPPAISPLVLPTREFSGLTRFSFGPHEVELIELDIHSDDATVLWLLKTRVLLAGDTVEDCATYVGAPEDFSVHLRDLARLAALKPKYILPDHGAPDVIAQGGYGIGIIAATQRYIGWLIRLSEAPDLAATPLKVVIARELEAGVLRWFDGYEAVHRENIERPLAHFASQPQRSAKL